MKYVLDKFKISNRVFKTAIVLVFTLILLASFYVTKKNIESSKDVILREYYMSEENILKNKTYAVYDNIIDYYGKAENEVKDVIKSRVDQAYHTIESIDNNNPDLDSLQKKQIIINALKDIKFSPDEYFFLVTSDYESLLDNRNLGYDRQKIEQLKDVSGKYFMKEMVTGALSGQEGFISYYWPKMENPGKPIRKQTYYRYYKDLDLIIGTGMYLDDSNEFIKSEVRNRLQELKRFNADFFIYDPDGTPEIGSNVEIDKNFPSIKQALESFGETTYYLPSKNGNSPIAYLKKIEEYGWYIITTSGVSHINSQIDTYESESKLYLTNKIISILIVLLFLGLFVVFMDDHILKYFVNDKPHSEIVYGYILDGMEKGIVVVDRNFVIETCNEKGREILGLKMFLKKRYNLKKNIENIEFAQKQFVYEKSGKRYIVDTQLIDSRMIVEIKESI